MDRLMCPLLPSTISHQPLTIPSLSAFICVHLRFQSPSSFVAEEGDPEMKRVFSGIQPTGTIHIGNYAGAIRNWVRLQDQYECIYCIVDYHAITILYEPKEMPRRVFDAALDILACGVDPDRATLMVQSHVPEHTELCWIFNTLTPLGSLERMTQFKEKSEQFRESVNAGLFDYPVLQAADICLYKAEAVP